MSRTPRHSPGKRESFPVVKSISMTDEQAVMLAKLAAARGQNHSECVREMIVDCYEAWMEIHR